MKKITGIVVVALALVAAIAPQLLDCAAHGRVMTIMGVTAPMKCYWTALGEVAVGLPLGMLGVAMFTQQRKSTGRILNILGILLGGTVALLPVVVGVCANADMLCNMVMKPLLILSGIVIAAVSAANLVNNERTLAAA
jgi:hypothetical protein